jgi:hypothetical protein
MGPGVLAAGFLLFRSKRSKKPEFVEISGKCPPSLVADLACFG